MTIVRSALLSLKLETNANGLLVITFDAEVSPDSPSTTRQTITDNHVVD